MTSLQIDVHQRVLVARPGIDARQLIQEAEQVDTLVEAALEQGP